MARFSLFLVAVVSIVLSGVSAKLLPDLPLPLPQVPTIIPVTKQAAVNQVNRGVGVGKGSINLRLAIYSSQVNADRTLTPASKQCIIERADATRAESLGQMDAVRDALVYQIQNLSPNESLASTWLTLIGNLVGSDGLINQVRSDVEQSLENGRNDCLQVTSTSQNPDA